MKHRIICLVPVLLLAVVFARPVQGEADYPHIRAILEELDTLNTFAEHDFSAVITLLTEDPDKGMEQTVVRQFRRDAEDQFVMLIQEPRAQRGQGYLMDGDNLWFYDPSSRQFSHTSLKEAFESSEARHSDFSSWSYAADYDIDSYAEGRLGAHDVYEISLTAKSDGVTYPYVKLWVTQASSLLLRSEDYSLNRRLMRTSLFPNYARVGDNIIPQQIIFVDELVEGRRTQISLSELSTRTIPDHVFTRAYLERVSQ